MAFRDVTTGVVEYGDNLLPFTANEAVKRGQMVKVAGEDIGVAPSDADGETVIGLATQSVEAGDQVTVAMPGCEVLATSGTGSITRNDPVASHGGTGEEGEVATAASGDETVGIALEGDAGDGEDVRVFLDLGAGGQVN